MKNLILVIVLNVFSHLCFGQKMLNEVRLTNPLLQEISRSSIPDVKTYQKEKFKTPKGYIITKDFSLSINSKLYKLKGSDDLIEISPKQDKQPIENWDKTVPAIIETFTPLSPGMERYTEDLTGQGYKATFFFVKGYKSTNWNHILYKNADANITLIILYISNSPDSVKIETMRKIVRGMKFN